MGTNLTYLQVVAIAFFALEFRTVKCHAAPSRNFEHAWGAIFQPLDLQKRQSMEASMGGLVLTKGTRLLIKQLNQEFGKHIDHYRQDNNNGTQTPISQLFADATQNLYTLTYNIKLKH